MRPMAVAVVALLAAVAWFGGMTVTFGAAGLAVASGVTAFTLLASPPAPRAMSGSSRVFGARGLTRWIAGPVLLGVAVGWGAFAATSQHEDYLYLGPLCRAGSVQDAGFDPWTGAPVGNIYVCAAVLPGDPPAHHVSTPIPPDLVGRRAIPVPVGFALGSLGSAFILWTWRLRRSADLPHAAGPAA